MIKHFFLAAGLALCVSIAHADEWPVPYERGVSLGHQAVADDPSVIYVEYSGREAQALLKTINDTDPPTTFLAERIITIGFPGTFVVVGLVHDGCVFQSYKIPESAWAKIVKDSLGGRT